MSVCQISTVFKLKFFQPKDNLYTGMSTSFPQPDLLLHSFWKVLTERMSCFKFNDGLLESNITVKIKSDERRAAEFTRRQTLVPTKTSTR